ncbi:MAG TPA: hypothetical protein VHR41_04350 [Gemmatimonadales bacterium]|jgi:hypothetical protein|nr:hypothetical protein [Gemmatimonadales bacterium]
MKAPAVVLLLGLVAPTLSPLPAQDTPNRVIKDVPNPIRVRVVRTDILRVDADTAYVYNKAAYKVLIRRLALDSALIDSLRARVGVAGAIDSLRQQNIKDFAAVVQIQNQTYDTLHARFATADSLGKESVRNTAAALAYARRVKTASIVAGGLVGGVVGGLGIKPSGKNFDWGGFTIGAALGATANWLLFKVVR